eukprot:403346710
MLKQPQPTLTYTITATEAMLERFSQTGSLERDGRIIGSGDSQGSQTKRQIFNPTSIATGDMNRTNAFQSQRPSVMGGTLGAAGASIASAGSAVSQITGRNNNSFKGVLDNLESQIIQLRSELEFAKKEVQVLAQDKQYVEMSADQRYKEVQKYLSLELQKLDEGIQKHNTKQKAENSRFQAQIGHCKEIRQELDSDIQIIKSRIMNVENHLGVNENQNNSQPHSPLGARSTHFSQFNQSQMQSKMYSPNRSHYSQFGNNN